MKFREWQTLSQEQKQKHFEECKKKAATCPNK